ncbi:unnamed protein product [Larinioides sclopetarius]|uniref:BTB domain-containing protein n=1 Tax=Larinioides sclopetarius TaxID=280406 RepID=A0AAV2AGE0_9ARAC
MVKIPFDFRPKKREKIVFKFVINNFNPHLFGTPDFEFFEGPRFQLGGATFKVFFVLCYVECRRKVTCLLTNENNNIPDLVHYFVDSKITIHRNTWKQPENVCDNGKCENKYFPLMDVSDLRNKNNYPTDCKLTIQFNFQRRAFQKNCPRYFSAITELGITTASRFTSFSNPYSSEFHEESVEDVPRNDVAENVENELTQNIPLNTKTPDIKMFFIYSSHENSLNIMFISEWDCVLLRYKTCLFDVKRNIAIASKMADNVLIKSETWFSNIVLPRYLKEEIEMSPSAFETLGVYTNVSYYNGELRKDSELEFGSSFSSNERKIFDLKADLKNLNRNRTRRADICIRNEENTFEAHKCILAARSPVFKAMLQSDTLESRTGVLKVVEMNSKELRLFLNFIYSSEFDEGLECETVFSLYAAADKYGISSLSRVCRRELKKNISLDNLHELLYLSHLHRDVELKEFIIKFLSTWYPNSKVIFHLRSMGLDQPLTEEDIEFFEGLSSFYRLMENKDGDKRKDACIREIPRRRSCKRKK